MTPETNHETGPHTVTTHFLDSPTIHYFINKPERDHYCDYLERKGWSLKGFWGRGHAGHYVYEIGHSAATRRNAS